MIDHVSVGVRSFQSSEPFYTAVLTALGMEKLVEREKMIGYGIRYPEIWIHLRPRMSEVDADTGCHIALRTKTADDVSQFHAAGVGNGGQDNGAPGVRHYSKASVFAAFLRDPDGNRLEACAVVGTQPAGV